MISSGTGTTAMPPALDAAATINGTISVVDAPHFGLFANSLLTI